MLRSHNLQTTLRDCQRLLEEGHALQECLDLYPDLAPEIRAHFELRQVLEGAKVAPPPDEAIIAGRRLVLSAVAMGAEKDGSMFSAPLKKVLATVGAFVLLGSLAVGAGAASHEGVGGPVGSLLAELGVGSKPNQPVDSHDGGNLGLDAPVDSDDDEENGSGDPACREATQHALEVLKARRERKEQGSHGIENAINAIENCGNDKDEEEEAVEDDEANGTDKKACKDEIKDAISVLKGLRKNNDADSEELEEAVAAVEECLAAAGEQENKKTDKDANKEDKKAGKEGKQEQKSQDVKKDEPKGKSTEKEKGGSNDKPNSSSGGSGNPGPSQTGPSKGNSGRK